MAQQIKVLDTKKDAKPVVVHPIESAKQDELTKADTLTIPPDTHKVPKARRIILDKKMSEQTARKAKEDRLHQTELQNQNAERRALPLEPTGEHSPQGVEAQPITSQPQLPAATKVKNPKAEPFHSKTGPKSKNKPVRQAKEEKPE